MVTHLEPLLIFSRTIRENRNILVTVLGWFWTNSGVYFSLELTSKYHSKGGVTNKVPSVAAYSWLERQRGNLHCLAANRYNRSFDRNCSCTRGEDLQESTSKSAPKPLLVCQSWASSMSLVSSELVGGRPGGCRRRHGIAGSCPELAMGSLHTHPNKIWESTEELRDFKLQDELSD